MGREHSGPLQPTARLCARWLKVKDWFAIHLCHAAQPTYRNGGHATLVCVEKLGEDDYGYIYKKAKVLIHYSLASRMLGE